MERINRNINKINADIKSAGQSFLGMRMGDLISRVRELDDNLLKSKLIEEYYLNQIGYADRDINGTRTRVNSAIRIIKADKVLYCLKQIDGGHPSVDMHAVRKAKETIEKIHIGDLKLPELE